MNLPKIDTHGAFCTNRFTDGIKNSCITRIWQNFVACLIKSRDLLSKLSEYLKSDIGSSTIGA